MTTQKNTPAATTAITLPTWEQTIDGMLETKGTLIRMRRDQPGLYVVTDTKGNYVVIKDAKGMAQVSTGMIPYVFALHADAYRAGAGFLAYNGNGEIVWQILTVKQYVDAVLPALEETIEQLLSFINHEKAATK